LFSTRNIEQPEIRKRPRDSSVMYCYLLILPHCTPKQLQFYYCEKHGSLPSFCSLYWWLEVLSTMQTSFQWTQRMSYMWDSAYPPNWSVDASPPHGDRVTHSPYVELAPNSRLSCQTLITSFFSSASGWGVTTDCFSAPSRFSQLGSLSLGHSSKDIGFCMGSLTVIHDDRDVYTLFSSISISDIELCPLFLEFGFLVHLFTRSHVFLFCCIFSWSWCSYFPMFIDCTF